MAARFRKTNFLNYALGPGSDLPLPVGNVKFVFRNLEIDFVLNPLRRFATPPLKH